MDFRIADTFTGSLTRLTGDEQKATKTTAFDLQVDQSRPGLQLHKLEGARDRNFWSVRVSKDIRIIVHRNQNSLMLCYVDHHDQAYRWAERRKLETHPKTGAAQLVEVRETVEEIAVPVYLPVVQEGQPNRLPFAGLSDDELLSYGVPVEWLHDIRAADEDGILDLASHLPSEAAEALLELATGGTPRVPVPVATEIDPFDHPDAQRRFRTMRDWEALERALDYPWDKWAVFLHPAQRAIVERDYTGPARVLRLGGYREDHRCAPPCGASGPHEPQRQGCCLRPFRRHLPTLCVTGLRLLVSSEPRLAERVEVYAIDALGERLFELNLGAPSFASDTQIRTLMEEAAANVEDSRFAISFTLTEWEQVVDAWQLDTWEAYRDVPSPRPQATAA